jgi:hypothetical protein
MRRALATAVSFVAMAGVALLLGTYWLGWPVADALLFAAMVLVVRLLAERLFDWFRRSQED